MIEEEKKQEPCSYCQNIPQNNSTICFHCIKPLRKIAHKIKGCRGR